MAGVRWNDVLSRVLIEDLRGDTRFLRVTLHRDAGVVVFSQRHGDECVAATQVPVTALGDLVGLLAEALDELPV